MKPAPLFSPFFIFFFSLSLFVFSLSKKKKTNMDSFDLDNVKAEKAKALRRFNRFRRIGCFFRAAEVCVALLLVFWTFTRLPFAVQISGAFLRRIATLVSTPLFVFLLGNSIVLVLLTKSSSDQTTASPAAASSTTNAETEIYEAFVRSVENRSKLLDEDEIVYHDKQVIVTHLNADENITHVQIDHPSSKVYGRSKSDVSEKQSSSPNTKRRSLQRSKTDKCCIVREIENQKEDERDDPEEDDMSNEEFQKTIEAFIAKERLFRRQESLAVVVHNIKP
ncbi:PREDICTED: uncharacterized protein LOC104745832 [Camelina sativa]|uniref:Uncharacterized protein LOC104745832 n=1 Tax=Camelina sativa TaxID=90675 RepID=A0ABM0W4B2_CAMSA|nr:PREDICTED: uncharacterized protein LOC104745832 [Camelina sativa]